MTLALRRSVWPDGERSPDDYEIRHDGRTVGRICRKRGTGRSFRRRLARSWGFLRPPLDPAISLPRGLPRGLLGTRRWHRNPDFTRISLKDSVSDAAKRTSPGSPTRKPRSEASGLNCSRRSRPSSSEPPTPTAVLLGDTNYCSVLAGRQPVTQQYEPAFRIYRGRHAVTFAFRNLGSTVPRAAAA